MSPAFTAGQPEANTAPQESFPTAIYDGITVIKDGYTLLHPISHAVFLLSSLPHSEWDPPGSSTLNLEHSLERIGTLI